MKNKGFGLIEVMVVLAILGVIMTGLSRYMVSSHRQVSQVKMFTEIGRLMDQVYRTSRELPALNLSASLSVNDGTGLKECLEEAGVCEDTSQGNGKGFLLAGGKTGRGYLFLAGKEDVPVYYLPNGEICRDVPTKCPLSLIIRYKAHCSLDPNHVVSECDRAQMIELNYSLSQTYLSNHNRYVPISRFSSGDPNGVLLKPREGQALVYLDTQQSVPSFLNVRIVREPANAVFRNQVTIVFNDDNEISLNENRPTRCFESPTDRGQTLGMAMPLEKGCCNEIRLEATIDKPRSAEDCIADDPPFSSLNTRSRRDAHSFRVLDYETNGHQKVLRVGLEDGLNDSYDDYVFRLEFPSDVEVGLRNGDSFNQDGMTLESRDVPMCSSSSRCR